jgi:hypothetical protein
MSVKSRILKEGGNDMRRFLFVVLPVFILWASLASSATTGWAQVRSPEQALPGQTTGVVNVRDYGAAGDGRTDDTKAIQGAIEEAQTAGGATVLFPPGTYRCELTLATISQYRNAPYASLQGSGTNATRLMAIRPGRAVINMTGNAAWEWTWAIRDLSFVGNGCTSNGVDVNKVSGVLGCYFQNVAFFECDYGFRNQGALWYTFDHCTFSRNNFGTYIEAIPTMHGGCGFFQNCNWCINAKAGLVLLEASNGVTVEQVHIIGGVNEGNPGFAFFSKGGGSWAHPLIIDNVYMEGNATAASVTIVGESYKPTDIYLENVGRAVIQNLLLTGVYVASNTLVTANNCTWYETSNINVVPDANSAIVFNDLLLNSSSGVFPHFVNSGMGIQWGGTRSTTWQTHLGNAVAWDQTNLLANGLCAVKFRCQDTNGLPCSFVNMGTPLGLGLCARLDLRPNATSWDDGIRLWSSSVRVTKGKWYVWSMDLRATDKDGLVSFLGTGREGLVSAKNLPIYADRWTRYVGCKQAVYGGDIYIWSFFNQTPVYASVLVCDAQLVEFPEWQQAYQYILSRRVAPDSSIPRPFVSQMALVADYAVNPSTDNGRQFTNVGTSNLVTVRLGAATAGQRYVFTRIAAYGFRVAPKATDRFRRQSAGESLELNTDGESATVQCLEDGIWDILARYNPN